MKRYRNLKEIDNDLRIMELKVHLEREKINIGIAELKKQTQPQALLKDFLASSVKHISVFGLLRGLFKSKKKRKSRKNIR